MIMYVILRGGRIINGMANPWFLGDVGIQDDRIVKIGKIHHGAENIIDVKGLYICPGFIDMHCHSELLVLDEDPIFNGRIVQGITTELWGQDGISVAPVTDNTVYPFQKMIKGLLGTSQESWRWRTFNDFMSVLA
jgi:N-acyl-D-amino-acid deacylase